MKKQIIYLICAFIVLLFIITIPGWIKDISVKSSTESSEVRTDVETLDTSVSQSTETETETQTETEMSIVTESEFGETEETETEELFITSVEDLPLEEYLSTYGTREYISDYLRLSAVENVTYVPQAYGIQIYYTQKYIGMISVWDMVNSEWTNENQYVNSFIGGARSLMQEVTLTEEIKTPYLAMIFYRADELFGSPKEQEELLQHEYLLSEEDIWDIMDTCSYEILYGTDGSKYAYKMTLSSYFTNEDMLKQLVHAVDVNDKSFSEKAYRKMSIPATIQGYPDSVLEMGEVKFPDHGSFADKDYSFAFGIGDMVYHLPKGTVAIETDTGWKLYAYVSFSLSEIGTIQLSNVSMNEKSAEQIVKEYVEDSYQSDSLKFTENGFEYHSLENNVAKVCIYNKNVDTLLVAEYISFSK